MSNTEQKPVIKISEILAKLANGQSRKDIAKELGISFASAQKHIFSHPKLKNRKTLSATNFVLEDDADNAPVTAPAVVAEEVAETVEEVAETVEEVATSNGDVAEDATPASWRE